MPTAAAGPTRLLADTRWWARATGHWGTQSKDRKRENEWKSLIDPSTLSFVTVRVVSSNDWNESRGYTEVFVLSLLLLAAHLNGHRLLWVRGELPCVAKHITPTTIYKKKIQEKDAKLNFSCLQGVTWHSNRNYQNPFSVYSSRYCCNNLVLLVLFEQRHWWLCISHVIHRSRSQRSDIRNGCTNASFVFRFFFKGDGAGNVLESNKLLRMVNRPDK